MPTEAFELHEKRNESHQWHNARFHPSHWLLISFWVWHDELRCNVAEAQEWDVSFADNDDVLFVAKDHHDGMVD